MVEWLARWSPLWATKGVSKIERSSKPRSNSLSNSLIIYIGPAVSARAHYAWTSHHGNLFCVRITKFTCKLLTHWDRVTHICVSKLTIIGSDNGLWPGRRQAIIWTIAGILLIGPLGANFSEISSAIHIFSLKKMHLKMSSGNCQPSCLSLNVLNSISCKCKLGKMRHSAYQIKTSIRWFCFFSLMSELRNLQ